MPAENRFVFVCPMHNASETVGQMLASVVAQSYQNWRVILIDDVSDQREVVKEAEIITRWRTMCQPGMRDDNCDSQIQVRWNDDKKWEVANVLFGISMCEDNDIVCRLDADDALCDIDALWMINEAYKQTDCDALWTMHRWGKSDRNISGPMPQNADPYKHPWVSSHMKTFRKRLINGVPYENFTNMNGELVRRAGDQAIYLPVLHSASRRVFLPRVVYSYSIDERGGAVYQTDDAKFQKNEAEFLRARGYIVAGEQWEQRLRVHNAP
jgi:glycosyltransferase involved in cell wall biosynthesis